MGPFPTLVDLLGQRDRGSRLTGKSALEPRVPQSTPPLPTSHGRPTHVPPQPRQATIGSLPQGRTNPKPGWAPSAPAKQTWDPRLLLLPCQPGHLIAPRQGREAPGQAVGLHLV